MTAAAILQTFRTELPLSIEPTDSGVTVRWEGGEVSLQGEREDLEHYIEALLFCYEAGFDEASNPRLFVP